MRGRHHAALLQKSRVGWSSDARANLSHVLNELVNNGPIAAVGPGIEPWDGPLLPHVVTHDQQQRGKVIEVAEQ